MSFGVFRVRVPGDRPRLARGRAETGPVDLLPPELSLDGLLSRGLDAFSSATRSAQASGTVPGDAELLAPVESQEVWAAGVTYRRSREARVEEAHDPSPYDRVYVAERPELFFKSPGWRVKGPAASIAIRRDSTWDVPEPELALVLAADLRVAGYTIGNDVSSRSIEGENPLYLPQAKVYDGSCALGPCVVPADELAGPFDIRLEVIRDGTGVFDGGTSTERMKRGFDELIRYLGAALRFPAGAVLLTGTGVVPDPPFTLQPGDAVRISIQGLGRLENHVDVEPSIGSGRGQRIDASRKNSTP